MTFAGLRAVGRAAVIVAVWLLGGLPGAMAQGPVTAPPGAAGFRLGAFAVIALRDGGFVTPNDGQDFGPGVGVAAVTKLLRAAGEPTDAITLNVGALLVRTPGHLVLIDTGLGPAHHAALPASLAMAGVSPAEITDVLITHGHFDHVGGLVGADGRSAFPRARIWLSAREWASFKQRTEAKRVVAAVAGQVTTFEPGAPILPGITPRELYGHTPGHVGYEIVSRGRRLEDIGDVAHSTILSLARPAWTEGLDEDPAAGAATRLAELKRLAASGELVFAPHFPFPGVGRIVASGGGFRWKPARGRIKIIAPPFVDLPAGRSSQEAAASRQGGRRGP